MFDGLEQARDLDEICSLLLSEKTDPPLPDSPYILATLRSDHTSGLKPVLQQVSMNELFIRVAYQYSYSTVCGYSPISGTGIQCWDCWGDC